MNLKKHEKFRAVAALVLVAILATGIVGVGVAGASLGNASTSDAAETTTGTIETFDVTDQSSTGYYGYAYFGIDWSVDTDAGDTVAVTVTNLDTGSVVAEYSGASGSESPYEYYTDGDTHEIEIVVQGDGPTKCQRYVGPADGSTSTLQFEDCSESGQPDISQTDLTLSDTETTTGDSVTVDATYANNGDAQGTKTVDLAIDGSVVDSQQLTLAAGESTTVSFDYTFDTAGEYTVAVDGTTAGTVTVSDPTEGPSIDTLAITDNSKDGGFIGQGEINLTVEWAVSGSAADTTVTVENLVSGNSETYSGQSGVETYVTSPEYDYPMLVTVEATASDGTTVCREAFDYGNGVNNFTKRDCVENGQPTFELTDLRVSDQQIEVGQSVDVTAEYTNVGDAYGEKTVEFTTNGTTKTRQVRVLPGRSRTASLTEQYDEPGTYTYTVEDQSVTVDVTRAQEPDISVVDARIVGDSDTVDVGEPVEVEVTLENIGAVSGDETVTLTTGDSDDPLDQTTVTVGAGEKAAATLTTTFEQPTTSTNLYANDYYIGGISVLGPDVPVTEEYDLLPSQPETVEITVKYDFSGISNDFEGTLTELIFSNVEVVDTNGLTVDGQTVTADAAADQGSVTYRKQIKTDRDGRGITSDWAFFSAPNYRTGTNEVTVVDRTGTAKVTGGDDYVYIGPHTTVSETTSKQTITLVVAEDANFDTSAQQLLDTLTTMSEDLDVGAADDVIGYGVPTDVRGPNGRASGDNDWFWFRSAPSVVVHEYTHTRQAADGEAAQSWRTEAIAEYYEGKYTFRYGGLSYDEARAFTTGDPVDLPAENWEDDGLTPDYTHGSDVINAIDSRVIEATDGQKSFEAVFARMNDGESLQQAYEAVTGESFDDFYATYVEGANRPAYDRDPAKYDFTQTKTVSGTLPQEAASTGFVYTSSIGEPFVQFNASNTHPETGLIDSNTVFAPHTYTYPDSTTYSLDVVTGVEAPTLSRESDWNVHSVGYVQETEDGQRFPRDGIPDVYLLGAADSPNDLPTGAEPVTIDVVDKDGQSVAGRTIAVAQSRSVDSGTESVRISGTTTADGEFVPATEPGIELSGSFDVRYEGPGFSTYSFGTTADRPKSVRILDGGVDQSLGGTQDVRVTLFGTIVPDETVTPGSEVTVEVLYDDADADGTLPVYVDGQQVDTVDIPSSITTGTAEVTLTLEGSGDRTVRVGDGPAQTVTVEDSGTAEFVTTDITLSDQQVTPGDTVDIDVEVTNTGSAAGTAIVQPTADGETLSVPDRSVTLDGGQSQTVTFSYTPDQTGQFQIGTNLQVADSVTLPTLTVEESSGGPTVETFDVVDQSSTGYYGYAYFGIDWSVADADSVTVTVTNLDTGSVLAEYSGASGSESPYEYYTDGDTHEIELVATAADGSTVCQRYVGPADGSTSTLEQQDCTASASADASALAGPTVLHGSA